MHKCFLTAAFIFGILSPALFSQVIPLDQRVRDSLFLIKPHENQVQKAIIYLDVAQEIMNIMPQKAFSYIVPAFRISILEKNNSLKARARMLMGSYYSETRKFMQSQEQYLAAWKTYRELSDTLNQVVALSEIGMINRNLKNNKASLGYLHQALLLAEKSKDKSSQGGVLQQIALTYQAIDDNETANSFFNRALSFYLSIGDRRGEFRVQINLGRDYLGKNRFEQGLAFYGKLIRDADTSDFELLSILYTRLGHVYYQKNDFRTSLKYNRLALHVRQLHQLPVQVNSSLINIAGDFYKLGKPDSGALYMDSGMILARRFDRKEFMVNGYHHLYEYFFEQGDYKKALNYYCRYSSVKDEIDRERYRSNFAIFQTNQQLFKSQQSGRRIARQHSISSLNLKLQNYQTVTLEVLLGVTAISMIIFILWHLYIRSLKRQMQELNVQLSGEISERETTEHQTRERETQYKFIADNSSDFITQVDHQGNRIYASPSSLTVYGYKPDEILSKSLYDLTHPDYHASSDAKFAEMLESGSSQQFTGKAQKKDGSVFWVESIINPLFDPISGAFKGMVSVTRDIQERKNKEFDIMDGTKQKENLLKEIHHRVKNNFAILVSLINMQMAQTKNHELLQSLTNLQLRIRTMALVHEMLYRSGDFEKISFPGYLRSLASVIAGTFNRRNVDLSIEAEEVVMDIEALIPLGLIINEILSNAYKHAFPNEREGKIQIRFSMDKQTGINTLLLRDDGIGMPVGVTPDQFKTMGLQIVQILCTQIEATLLIANDPGTSFTITFRNSEKE